MEAESFFQRWSKRKTGEADLPTSPASDRNGNSQAAAPAAESERPPPTLDDVAKLTPDADFRPFVARGVDEEVRRSAMKKLFADPHFNVMDGLDIYIDDYGKPDPIPPAMLAAMTHARDLLKPEARVETTQAQLLQTDETMPAAPIAEGQEDAGMTAGAENDSDTPSDGSANDDPI